MLDREFINRLVFHTRIGGPEPNFPVRVDGVTLGCHVRPERPGALTLIYFHGNGELAGDCAASLGPWLQSLGVRPGFVEYRGYGHSTGRATLAGMLGDGEAVVHALGIDPARAIAFGRSLGSLYAVELARRLPTLGGLILESGIANLMDLSPVARLLGPLGGWPGHVAARMVPALDQRVKLRSYPGPTLVLHTRDDTLVPVSHATRLHEWAAGERKKLVVFERGGHNAILADNVAEYTTQLREFLAGVGNDEV